MNIDFIGWDIGGAHLKAVGLSGDCMGRVIQKPCPLWQGLGHFHDAMEEILQAIAPRADCRHAVTMTGELVDLFPNRQAGVSALTQAMAEHCEPGSLVIFAGRSGFVSPDGVNLEHAADIASANWLATGQYVASQGHDGLLIDIGSTTSDLLLIRNTRVEARGYTDFERMRFDELVYTGLVRTPLMAVAETVPFEGEWISLMAEHFATTADVYRLLDELPEHADQLPTADGSEKTPHASARRIARLLGRDVDTASENAWAQLAAYFRDTQLQLLARACQRQLSRLVMQQRISFIGAGVGRHLVQKLACRLGHPYLDIDELFPHHPDQEEFHCADCAPAAAVAFLARRQLCR